LCLGLLKDTYLFALLYFTASFFSTFVLL